jgi:hypothetical protein
VKAIRSILTSALIFAAGTFVGHYNWPGRSASASSPSSPAPRVVDPPAETVAATDARASVGTPSRPTLAAASQGEPSSTSAAANPPGAEAASELTSVDDAQSSRLVEAPIAIQEPVSVQKNPDGSRDVFGKTADGRDAFRHFNPRDEITREGWSTPTGENFYRSYYEQGGVKQVSLTHPDRTYVSITLGQSGQYESRYEQMPDGSGLSTEYDDSGNVSERVRIEKDGSSVAVE